jgi:hypothetical protein
MNKILTPKVLEKTYYRLYTVNKIPLATENQHSEFKDILSRYIRLSRFNTFAMLLYAVLSLVVDIKVCYFSGHKVNKFLLFMALGFLLFVNLMALH